PTTLYLYCIRWSGSSLGSGSLLLPVPGGPDGVVLPKESLGVVHIGAGIDVLDPPLLPGFRPLACDEQHRGCLTTEHCLADGLPPVGLDLIGAALPGHMAGDLPADGQCVLLPGVLLSEDHQVRVFSGHLPQVPAAVKG